MPYIKKELRNSQTLNSPATRGELNWSLTTQMLQSFKKGGQGYNDHCEIRALLYEILQGIILEVKLVGIKFPEFSEENRELLRNLDETVWDYLCRTGDTSGAKQVLRDAGDEWYRRFTSKYEDKKASENGDLY